MKTSVHGHEVIEMVMSASPPLSREALVKAVEERFGADACFHTCMSEELNLDGLLRFLTERGKIMEVDGVLRTADGLQCGAEE